MDLNMTIIFTNINMKVQTWHTAHTLRPTYLVLAPPSDVSAERELILAEVVLREHVVELVHGQVDDVPHREWQSQSEGLPLVSGESVPAADEAARVFAVRRCGGCSRCGSGGNRCIFT